MVAEEVMPEVSVSVFKLDKDEYLGSPNSEGYAERLITWDFPGNEHCMTCKKNHDMYEYRSWHIGRMPMYQHIKCIKISGKSGNGYKYYGDQPSNP